MRYATGRKAGNCHRTIKPPFNHSAASLAQLCAPVMAHPDMTDLGKLVAQQHGWPAAKAFKAYHLSDEDRGKLTDCALDILRALPSGAGTSALMSAAFAVRIEQMLGAPVHVIAGTLSVENTPVLRPSSAITPGQFMQDTAGWDGHIWVMIGPYIADIAIFRLAYASDGPAALSRHIDLVFGPDKGLYVDTWRHTRQLGLGYDPLYVLSADEVTQLMGQAFHRIQEHRAAGA